MIQEASDADVIAHAERIAERHRARAADDAVAADLLAEVDALISALRRHQPIPPEKGWNDAWSRFDQRPPQA